MILSCVAYRLERFPAKPEPTATASPSYRQSWERRGHLQTFEAHVKVASMEDVCNCIGQFSSS